MCFPNFPFSTTHSSSELVRVSLSDLRKTKGNMSRPRVGFRFMPSDVEIISYFLKHKMDGNDFLVNDDVREIDVCKHEPRDLPSLCANGESDDQTWYFFCKLDRNKSHQRRTTEHGYWKSTGQDRNIKNKVGKVIGTKKTLRFHIGRTPRGKQTEWTIHEYNSSSVPPHQTRFVLCKLMKKNAGKADALACHEDKPLGNPPSNNENDLSEFLIAGVHQERSFSPNVGDYFHPPEMPQLDLPEEEVLPFIHDNLYESAGLRSSSVPSENELELADSFLTFQYESLSPALNNAYHENINNKSYAGILGGSREFQGASTMQARSPVPKPKEYQRRQSVSFSGTLPSLKHDDNLREKIVLHGGAISEKENSSAVVTVDTASIYSTNVLNRVTYESSSGSTTPGDYEIYLNGQEFSESSSDSSTTPKQDVHFIGQEWPGSNSYSTKNRSARGLHFQCSLPNEQALEIRKPTSIHPSLKKNSDDSGKMKRLLWESEKDQITVVAATSSKLITFMSSLIRFETLPTHLGQNPPFVFMANILVGLCLFVVISREMLIFH